MKIAAQVVAAVAIASGLLAAGCSNSGSSSSPPPTSPTASTTPTASTPPAGQKVQLAYVTNNASDYWTIVRSGVNDAAKTLPNVNVQFVMPADGTAATQKGQVDDLVAKGVQGIAISPVDPANQTEWLKTVAAKTTLITMDSDAAQSNRVFYIGTDNHGAGLMCGAEIEKALPKGGKIVLFVGKSDAQNAHDRMAGIRDALKGSNIQILDVRTDDTDHARAKQNAADELVKNPDLAAEVGIWSYNGPAIVSAVRDANKVGKVKIVCFDQEQGTLDGIKSGAVFGTVVQQPYAFGHDGLQMLAKLVGGDKSVIPKNGTDYIPTEIIDSSNVDKYQIELNKQTGKS